MFCGVGLFSCVSVVEQVVCIVYLINVYVSVVFGYGKLQLLLFLVIVDGNFIFELFKLILVNVVDFYVNVLCISLVIENFNIGGIWLGYGQVLIGGYNMGCNEIFGFSFNYLKVMLYNF